MSDNSTIGVNLGGGVITTSGAANAAALQAIANFIGSQNFTFQTVGKGAFPLPAGVFGVLNADPTVTLNDTSAGVNTDGNAATITGGGAVTSILAGRGGALSYSGGAGHVYASSGSGTISSSAAAANVTAIAGNYSVSATGAGDSLLLGGVGGSINATASGGRASVQVQGGVNYRGGLADTITAAAGTSTVFGASGTNYTGNSASVLFIGVGTSSFVTGGSGTDTVFGDGTTFVGGSGKSVFVGSQTSGATGSSVVFGGDSGTLAAVGGVQGDLVLFRGAQGSFVSGGGKDTIWGGTSAVAPTIFGATNSYELLVSNMNGGLAIGAGNNTTLDGANTTGGLTYFANPGDGNQTFFGSATGNDSFYVFSQNVGQSLVEIHNWHAGDTLNLSAFGTADQAGAKAAFAAGGNLYKLSDGTTISFVGNHPTGGGNGFLT